MYLIVLTPHESTATNRNHDATPIIVSYEQRICDSLWRNAWAQRLIQEGITHADDQITRIFLDAYGRNPNPDELADCRTVLNRHGLGTVCRVILNSMNCSTWTEGLMYRRNFFEWAGSGIASTAFLSLLMQDGVVASESARKGAIAKLHLEPKAKRVIHIVACGGVSQVDSFDYKPELEKQHGKSLGGERPDVFFGKVGLLRKSDWAFRQRGQSGQWISELFPNLAKVADELTSFVSMVSETSNHTPATFQENSGFRLNGFPVFGAWASYGLGSETTICRHSLSFRMREAYCGGSIIGPTDFCRPSTRGS